MNHHEQRRTRGIQRHRRPLKTEESASAQRPVLEAWPRIRQRDITVRTASCQRSPRPRREHQGRHHAENTPVCSPSQTINTGPLRGLRTHNFTLTVYANRSTRPLQTILKTPHQTPYTQTKPPTRQHVSSRHQIRARQPHTIPIWIRRPTRHRSPPPTTADDISSGAPREPACLPTTADGSSKLHPPQQRRTPAGAAVGVSPRGGVGRGR